MKIALYQIDAFADKVFQGNPAAVCPLEEWLDVDLMQAIAVENNLSETAFFVAAGDAAGDAYELRWFTPVAEVDLCGHATLASAHVVFEHIDPNAGDVAFDTRSGRLSVTRGAGGLLTMDFPAQPGDEMEVGEEMTEALGAEPSHLFGGVDFMAVFERQSQISAIEPDQAALKKLERRGVIITAPGDEVDFVSRFFAPKHDIPEDPVTGSAHCMLTPYWAHRLGKNQLRARQISPRGGNLDCALEGERVRISGSASEYLKGEISL
ncbi:MAG: PhzF family phenazine biosynthesis protein [Alphaproteobacteria bacterium]|jgi:PhzF family phenazine biosynthesis protein|nr:PhzF family phenazine biosynthesis protein [Alphaproteobacteria bacterium]MDP6591482.1 PhzF family phenazine biosynthesis protein [Alphaproteobacteria bacterium]MDP6818184.1 PhzF family phenazine biosynthesis protein [Alphaproteobacteria bacterium]